MKRPCIAPTPLSPARVAMGAVVCLALSLLNPTGDLSSSTLQAQENNSPALSELKLPKIGAKKRGEAMKELEKATFKLVEGEGRIYFSLMVGEDVLLRSPGYATERAVNEAMDEVKTRIKRLRAMPLRQLKTGEHYFVVTTSRDDVLATSPLYASAEEARTMRIRVKGVLIEAK